MTEIDETALPRRKQSIILIVFFLFVAVTVVFAGLFWSRNRLETVLENRIDRLIADYSPVVSIQYEDVGVGFFGRSIRVDGIRITPIGAAAPVRIGSLVVHRFDHRHRIPQFFTLSAESLEIPGAEINLANLLPTLRFPDAGKLNADLFLDYVYDPEAREFAINRFSISAPDKGTLSMAAGIGNLALENAAMYLILPHLLLFEGMTVVYSDDSWVPRMMSDAAAREGMSPDEYARALKKDLESRAVLARQNGQTALAEALEAVIAFLEKPRTLVLESRPEHSVPFGSLMRVSTFEEFVELLDVRITANKYD